MDKKILFSVIVGLVVLLGGCAQPAAEPVEPEVTPTETLVSPEISRTQTPDVEGAAAAFLD